MSTLPSLSNDRVSPNFLSPPHLMTWHRTPPLSPDDGRHSQRMPGDTLIPDNAYQVTPPCVRGGTKP